MFTLIIWCSGSVLELVILLRAVQQKTLVKYPFFYLYVASLFLADASLYLVSVFYPSAYTTWNWNAGFLNIILSAGILLEIFKHALTPYPGAERFARTSGLLIFALLFSFGIAYLMFAQGAVESRFTVARNLERNLLAVQAIFLGALVAVIFYYGIAMGKNLQGMILGYGLCVASTLITLAVRSYAGHSFNAAWIVIQPLCYWVSLFVWMVALWQYEPNPSPRFAADIARDYEAFALGTRARVEEMRENLGRAARP
jgi:hypothetical protein